MNLAALQHSAFLQSLGWAIANSLWQGAVLWSIYLLVNTSYKNASSTFKTNSGTASLFLLFAWFITTFFQKFFQLLEQDNITASSGSSLTIHVSDSSSFFNWYNIIEAVLNTLPYLSVAYIFLLVVLTLRLINSYWHIYFIKQNGLHKAGVEWRLFAERVATHIGIAKKITLWLSDHVDVPATIGFIKPVILIPVASMNQLSVAQLEAIILHELSHIKRNDYLINLFISLIETILFFNPFVVLLSKIIKKERENSCDDFVIQYQYDRHSYASALLSLEQSRVQNLRLALTATSGKKQLLSRIQRIMEVNNGNAGFNYGQKLLALLLVTGIICSVAWLSPEKKDNSQRNIKTANHIEPEKVIDANKTKQVTVPANVSPKNSVTVKTKKSTPLSAIKALIENPDLASGNNDENDNNAPDDPALLTEENSTAASTPETNSTGFYNTDKLQKYTAAEHAKIFKKNKLFTTQPNKFNNAFQLLRGVVPVPIDLEKLKSDIENGDFSFNWKFDDNIKQAWDAQLALGKVDQKKMAELEKKVWQETQKANENMRERIRKSQRKEPARLNRTIVIPDSLYTTAIAMENKTVVNCTEPREEYLNYIPAVPAVVSNKRTPKQSEHFEYHFKINTDQPSDQKKLDKDECPLKKQKLQKINLECLKGTVYLNGKKITVAELNNITNELNLKKLSIHADDQHMEILIDN